MEGGVSMAEPWTLEAIAATSRRVAEPFLLCHQTKLDRQAPNDKPESDNTLVPHEQTALALNLVLISAFQLPA